MSNPPQTAKKLINPAEVRRAWDVLIAPGQVVELRALHATTTTSRYPYQASGYFNDLESLMKALSQFKTAQGIYITIQPCQPALLARAKNRIRSADEMKANKSSTSDEQIICYRWLPIDIDPDRASGISSTDEEHQAAIQHAMHIRQALRDESWPDPIFADSGNGAHLLYRIDLANIPENRDFMKRVLEGLAARFDVPGLHIDQTLFNPSRIIKLYGTLACKGDSTDERPHRLSRIEEAGTC